MMQNHCVCALRAVFKKEVEQLVSSGLFKHENDPEWGDSYFAQLKSKTNCVQFLSDLLNLNKQLKRKPYPMPKMREISFKSEIFKYTTPIYLNMGYCHILIS